MWNHKKTIGGTKIRSLGKGLEVGDQESYYSVILQNRPLHDVIIRFLKAIWSLQRDFVESTSESLWNLGDHIGVYTVMI